MTYKIEEIEGIGPAYAQKLAQAGIVTTADLLQHCGTPQGRSNVAARTGVSDAQLLTWANLADLMRISGVGKQYSELLEAAGVDTVKELQMRNPANLATQMKEVNEAKRLARNTPAESIVAQWVGQAAELPPAITY